MSSETIYKLPNVRLHHDRRADANIEGVGFVLVVSTSPYHALLTPFPDGNCEVVGFLLTLDHA
jgi:hypothetical protein